MLKGKFVDFVAKNQKHTFERLFFYEAEKLMKPNQKFFRNSSVRTAKIKNIVVSCLDRR